LIVCAIFDYMRAQLGVEKAQPFETSGYL